MIDVILMPRFLDPARLPRAQVVILDILRASSTIVSALGHGAREVRLFGTPAECRAARTDIPAPTIIGGERKCVRIDGFDCGNSPREYVTERVGGAAVLLTTTNGTVAALAAAAAPRLFVGSLLNAGATAAALLEHINDLDTFLLCAGTDGEISSEDMIGAGAILWSLLDQTHTLALPFTDTAWIAYQTFSATRTMLPAALRLGQGGINIIEAGLEDDIDFCARLDALPFPARIHKDPLRALRE